MKTDAKVQAYVAAVREVGRLGSVVPTDDYAAELAANLKAAKAKVAELYRTLRGSELGRARRILGSESV